MVLRWKIPALFAPPSISPGSAGQAGHGRTLRGLRVSQVAAAARRACAQQGRISTRPAGEMHVSAMRKDAGDTPFLVGPSAARRACCMRKSIRWRWITPRRGAVADDSYNTASSAAHAQYAQPAQRAQPAPLCPCMAGRAAGRAARRRVRATRPYIGPAAIITKSRVSAHAGGWEIRFFVGGPGAEIRPCCTHTRRAAAVPCCSHLARPSLVQSATAPPGHAMPRT